MLSTHVQHVDVEHVHVQHVVMENVHMFNILAWKMFTCSHVQHVVMEDVFFLFLVSINVGWIADAPSQIPWNYKRESTKHLKSKVECKGFVAVIMQWFWCDLHICLSLQDG